MKVAVLGGTGKLGQGFAVRLARTTHQYVIGSRDMSKGKPNSEAAAWCDVAIIAVPYQGHRELLESLGNALRGKSVIDATVPIDPSNRFQLKTESGKSAAEEASTLLPESHIFAAFQTVSHRVLQSSETGHDVLVAGPPEHKHPVSELIQSMNLRSIYVGPLGLSHILESLTVLLLSINKHSKVKESGIHITGI